MNETEVNDNEIILNNKEAMAFFRIKDQRVWRKFQAQYKIPFFFVGREKRYYRDVLIAKLKSISESTARKVYA
jgi:hypothetical protein